MSDVTNPKAEVESDPVDDADDEIATDDNGEAADDSDEPIEEEAPLDEPVAEALVGNSNHPAAEVEAIEVIPDVYLEQDEASDEAAALGLDTDESDGPVEPIVLDVTEAVDVEATPIDDPWTRPGEWFVVHTQSGYEKKVTANLHARIQSMNMEDKIFEVVIPMEDVVEFKGGRKQTVQRKVFPG